MQAHSFRSAASIVVDVVERIRVANKERFAGPVDLRLVDQLIVQLQSRISKGPWQEAFEKQLKNYRSSPRNRLACLEVESDGLTLLVGFMRPSKADDAFFEAVVFKNESVPPSVLLETPSIATPVSQIECTSGLRSAEMFGIFAEHFGYGLPEQQFWSEAKAFYLTDRFEQRFLNVTKPVIDRLTSQDSFRALKMWMSKEGNVSILKFAAWWLSLHEHFHSQGSLPFHQHMRVKGNRLAAGFEELRVDLLSILNLIRSGDDYQRSIAEYVIAERMFSYVLIDLRQPSRKRQTFDSVGSQIIALKLLEAKAMCIEDGSVRLEDHWPDAVQELSEEFAALETRVVNDSACPETRRAALLDYVRRVTHETALNTSRIFRPDDQVPVLEFFYQINDRLRNA